MEIAYQGLQSQKSKVGGFNCSRSRSQTECNTIAPSWSRPRRLQHRLSEGGGGWGEVPLLSFHPLSHPPASSVPTSMTDSTEGSGPASREGKETGVKMAQRANLILPNQPCCSLTARLVGGSRPVRKTITAVRS